MRLNVYISSSGFCSRRQADRYIQEGSVSVNGLQTYFNTSINEDDNVLVNNHLIQPVEHSIYLILNKPRGIICTSAKNVPENIIDFINYPKRIFPVGRLDKHSEGLLILTNDGPLVNTLLKKESLVEKEYVVTVNRPITTEFITHLSNGVSIYNPRTKSYTPTNPCRVKQMNEFQFSIILTQGLNRQIRRMCRSYQYTVTRLKRVRIKDLYLKDLPVGKWRYLTERELTQLILK